MERDLGNARFGLLHCRVLVPLRVFFDTPKPVEVHRNLGGDLGTCSIGPLWKVAIEIDSSESKRKSIENDFMKALYTIQMRRDARAPSNT